MAQQPGGLHREVFAGLLVEVVQIDAQGRAEALPEGVVAAFARGRHSSRLGATAGTRVGTIRLSWSICA
jgi:hypothetical protein